MWASQGPVYYYSLGGPAVGYFPPPPPPPHFTPLPYHNPLLPPPAAIEEPEPMVLEEVNEEKNDETSGISESCGDDVEKVNILLYIKLVNNYTIVQCTLCVK